MESTGKLAKSTILNGFAALKVRQMEHSENYR